MSTNSVVAYMREDGSIVSSYVHYDGYETGVGMTLLEYYSTEERALAVSTAGYFSSLGEDMEASLRKSVHTEKSDEFEGIIEFGEWLKENSHLEFGYLFHDGKWMVSSWSTTEKKVHNGTCFDVEFDSTWNGFEELSVRFVREGRKTIERFRSMDSEYEDYADILEEVVDRYHRTGMAEVAREVMAA
jgi:hypothetical protein